CATCHRADGGGGIGPNLTDDNWINKVQDSLFYNIYDIVYNGSPKNAQMRPFGKKGELTGLAIQDVASYVYYINQEQETVTVNEGGAAPQGDLITQWAKGGEGTPAPANSTPAESDASENADSSQKDSAQ